jgi:hypothetical protein
VSETSEIWRRILKGFEKISRLYFRVISNSGRSESKSKMK